METNNKLLSVVMPVYNVCHYLRATLDSVLEQTYQNWELYMVDDGSNDGSQEIAKEYVLKDSRIKFIQRESYPKGAPACRALGMKHIIGDYLIHLDSDDIIAPYCFQQRVDFMDSNPSYDFAVFPMMGYYNEFFDAKGMVFGYKTQGDDVFNLLARALPFVVATNIYRRESVIRHNIIWDTKLSIYLDSDYNLQSLRSGMTYKVTNGLPDYFYRLSAQNSVCKKIYTYKSCEVQLVFLDKQSSFYKDDIQYKKALLICAAQIYRNILSVPDNAAIIERFVGLELFKDCRLLKVNLKLVAKLNRIFKNDRISQVLQLLFCPFFYLRFVLLFKRNAKHSLTLYQELSQRYYEEVELEVRRRIESKI